MLIVTEQGFTSSPLLPATDADLPDTVEVPSDTDARTLVARFDSVERISIRFATFADGRGFSLAQRLRALGYRGHLRASGHIISDQFRYARQCGFDDVEISHDQAKRQPEADWINGMDAIAASYRDKLAGRVSSPAVQQGNEQVVPRPLAAPRSASYLSKPNVYEQRVTGVTHYTDALFSFRITRPAGFRFRSGEFAMIGLPNAARPVFRAYSLASPAWDDELEFYSIKVPGGPLTQHLANIAIGDVVLLKRKATGTLVLDALMPGRRLFLISTGTGVAPFASLLRDPETYEKFDQVVLTHTCRTAAELAFSQNLVAQARTDPLVGESISGDRLKFVTSLTREAHELEGRITTLLESGTVFTAMNELAIIPAHDRVMICGSMDMLRDTRAICERLGLEEGSNSRPGTFVVERAFVD